MGNFSGGGCGLMTLRRRGPVREEDCDGDVLSLAEDMRARNDRANHFFQAVFVMLSVGLAGARGVLFWYAHRSPFTFLHHAEAHTLVAGHVALLEAVGALSLLSCGLFFVRPLAVLLHAPLVANALLFCWMATLPPLRTALWER